MIFGFMFCLPINRCALAQDALMDSLPEKDTPDVEKSQVALTFDDGPSEHTPLILDILKQYDVRATFFVVGINAERHPDMIKRIADEGHIIGNHTYSHSVWSSIKTPSHIATELDSTAHLIYRFSGVYSTLFRPPHGWDSPWMLRQCGKMGYTTVKWTVDPKDWRHPTPAKIVTRIMNDVRNNGIILLHDGHQSEESPDIHETIEALPILIETLTNKGFIFVGIDAITGKGGPVAMQSPVRIGVP